MSTPIITDVAEISAGMKALSATPHRRFNPLSGEWVLVSPHRTERPWQGQVERTAPEQRPAYDPACYLCPGNTRAGTVGGESARNPQYEGTFVFDNDFAALRTVPADSAVHVSDASGLFRADVESGVCRVICFSPRHDQSLPDMDVGAIRRVVDVWAEQYEELGGRDDIAHVQIFENKGAVMGCSNPHPHGQIWAQRSIPYFVARETERQADYFARNGRTLLGDYLSAEIELGERVVCENDAFVAVVPFWAVWPFELLIISRRPVSSLSALTDDERTALADMVKRVTTRYDNLFETSFPYSAGLHQAPTDGLAHHESHLHMHFYPPLLRSATVRKFLVGYEMLGEPQRDLTVETAAARLRALSERHYKVSNPG